RMNGKNAIINVASREANIKRKLRRHLHALGFEKSDEGALRIQGSGKDIVRTLHRAQRQERLWVNREFIAAKAEKLLRHFASGKEIDPTRISPVLERVSAGTPQGDLFRLASLTWSVPVSNG